MTDEMLYVKVGLHMSDTLSPIPHVRGESVTNYSLLYPALLAPILAIFDMPAAFRIAHGMNALLMASTAIPTYLLAMLVTRSRTTALLAAAAAVAVPWLTLATIMFSESLAYLLFACALLAMLRALEEPSWRRDLLVAALIGALGVGIGGLVRNQVAAIVGVLFLGFVLEPVLVGLAPDVGRYAPTQGAPSGIIEVDPFVGEGRLLEPAPAVLVMLGWIGLLFTAAGARLRGSDLV